MKIESVKVTQQMGISPCAEIGPLFPPLHVNEMGTKTGVRAPPRNKMALFEQFTEPFHRHVPSHEVALINPSPMQHGANECHFDNLSCAACATLASTDTINNEVGTNVKSLHDSSIGSLSTCTAIVNMDESQRDRMQESAEDTSSLLRVTHEQIRRTDETVLKDTSKDVNELRVVDQSQSCGQPVGVILESFQNHEDSTAGGTFNAKTVNIMELSHQESITNCEGLASAGSQLSGPANGESEHNMNTDVLNYVQTKGSNQLESSGQFVGRPLLGRNADPHQTPEVISQDDSPCIISAADVKTPIPSASSREKMMLAMVSPFPDSLKPKDVINAVGQRLFWKARKAILRQQEVFSNQVFELHKLIKVQKLLAKIPLIGEDMLLEGASDKLGCDHLPIECGSNEKENLGDTRARAPASSKKNGGQARRSKPQQKYLPCEESEGQEVRAGVSSIASFPQVLTNAQPSRSLSSDGMSAWGYPMQPLNRPLVYPSGSRSLPSGLPFGGAYVVGPNPPIAPFTFPFYGQRPAEQTSAVCPNIQWPSAMYHNPFLAPAVNDWFAMNYQGRASLASGSEKAGPTSSVPSINMKADASSWSIQPAVFPCVRGSSSRLIASRSLGSHAAASISTPPNALSRKPGAGNVGEQSRGTSPGSGSRCVAPEGWGAYEGEKKKADTEALGRLRNVKGGQLPTINGRRADRMGVDSSLGGNALNLFPLQPSISAGGHSEGRISRQDDCQGRVIKAVPRSASAASESAAGILLSIQREKQL